MYLQKKENNYYIQDIIKIANKQVYKACMESQGLVRFGEIVFQNISINNNKNKQLKNQ